MKTQRYFWIFLVIATLVSCSENGGTGGYDPFDQNKDTGPYPNFPEMPEQVINSNYIYTTHNTQLNNRTVRNFTLCFDKTKYAARWVAYPLHSSYRGGSDRSYTSQQTWPQDPTIPENYQAIGKGGYNGYTRGHQIPSADRTDNTAMNKQTFYMSNMTPQAYDFNTGIWVNLEDKVRKYICNDTLYVVTGAHWGNGYKNAGKYPIPTHYYKVLLRTRKGNTRKSVYQTSPGDLKCIGFWLSHSANGTLNKSYCKSVADIERLTGFTFFPNVDVDKTECTPSDWGF